MILGKNFEVKFIKSKKFIDSGENVSKGISFIIWLRGFISEINDSHSLTDFSPLKVLIVCLKGSSPTSRLKSVSYTHLTLPTIELV